MKIASVIDSLVKNIKSDQLPFRAIHLFEGTSWSRYNKILKLRLRMNSGKEVAAAIGTSLSTVQRKIHKIDNRRRSFGHNTLGFGESNWRGEEKKQAADILEGVWVHYGPGNDEDEQFLGYSYPEQTDKLTKL
jgi:hypothetical protein